MSIPLEIKMWARQIFCKITVSCLSERKNPVGFKTEKQKENGVILLTQLLRISGKKSGVDGAEIGECGERII